MRAPAAFATLALLAGLLVPGRAGAGAGAEPPTPVPSHVGIVGAEDEPVSGAEIVEASVRDGERPLLDDAAPVLSVSGADGRIPSPPRPAAPAGRLAVRAPGHAAVLLPAVDGPVLVRLPPAVALAGTLRFPDGTVAAAVTLTADPLGGGELAHRTRTDEDGRFRFLASGPGAHRVTAWRGGGIVRDLGSVAAGRDPLSLVFPAGTTLRADVREPGAPTEGGMPTRGLHVLLRRVGGEGPVTLEGGDVGEGGALVVLDVPAGVYEAALDSVAWAWDEAPPRFDATGSGERRAGIWWARRAGAIVGRVLDPDGKPVVSARVAARPALTAPPRPDGYGARVPVSSGEGGEFRLDGLVASDGWVLTASAPGFAPAVVTRLDVRAGRDVDAGPVRLEAGWSVDVTVRDTEGRAVEGVAVEATPATRPLERPEARGFARAAKTDDRGKATLDGLAEDEAIVTARAKGFVPARQAVVRGRGRFVRIDLSLAPTRPIRGRVVGADGPLPAAVAVATSRRSSLRRSVAVGPDGRFEIEDLPPERFDVEVRWSPANGGAGEVPLPSLPQRPRYPVLARADDVLPSAREELALVVARLSTVSGLVRGLSEAAASSGSKAHVRVEARRRATPDEPEGWEVVAGAFTDHAAPTAAFRLPHLPPGAYRLRAVEGTREGGPVPVVVEGADVGGLELSLPAAGRVEGRVVDGPSKRPAVGARLALVRLDGGEAVPALGGDAGEALRPTATAGEDGGFAVDGLPPGAWRLEASDLGRAPTTVEVRVFEGQRLQVGTLTLTGGGTVEGFVHDVRGRALRGAVVEAKKRPDLGPGPTVPTGEDGRFRAERLAVGRYVLRVTTGTVGGPAVEAEAEVVEGATTSVDVGAGGDAVLSGTVRRRGTPVGGTAVEAVVDDAGGADRVLRRTVADAFGQFRFEALPPGRYALRTLDGGVALARSIVVREGDRVDRDLELGEARIVGSVRHARGWPVRDAEVVAVPASVRAEDVVGRARTGPDGTFQLPGLPFGTYHVEVTAPGRATRVVDGVVADLGTAARSVDVVVGAGARLDLRVLDDGRRGVGGAEVWIEDAAGVALHPRAYATTASGRLTVDGLPEGPARVRVRARGLATPRAQPVALRDGATTSLEVTVHDAAALLVRVYAGRDPVPRARIDLLRVPDGEAVVARRTLRYGDPDVLPWSTARTGVVLLEDLEEGDYVLRVGAGPEVEEARVPVRVARGTPVEVRVVLRLRGR